MKTKTKVITGISIVTLGAISALGIHQVDAMNSNQTVYTQTINSTSKAIKSLKQYTDNKDFKLSENKSLTTLKTDIDNAKATLKSSDELNWTLFTSRKETENKKTIKDEKKHLESMLEDLDTVLSVNDDLHHVFKNVSFDENSIPSNEAILDGVTNEKVNEINEKYKDKINFDNVSSKLVEYLNAAETQLKDNDNAINKVKKLYDKDKVISTDEKTINEANELIKKVKNESVKKDLKTKMDKVTKQLEKENKEKEQRIQEEQRKEQERLAAEAEKEAEAEKATASVSVSGTIGASEPEVKNDTPAKTPTESTPTPEPAAPAPAPTPARTDGFNFNGYHFGLGSFSGSGVVPADSLVYQWADFPRHYLFERAGAAGMPVWELGIGSQVVVNGRTYTVYNMASGVSRDAGLGFLESGYRDAGAISWQTCESFASEPLLTIWWAA